MKSYGYALLKQKVKMIILSEPIDMVDDDGSFHENALWELVHPRKAKVDGQIQLSRKIGAANIYQAYQETRKACVEQIKLNNLKDDPDELAQGTLKDILIDLKEDNIMRVIPERAREKIKLVVDNDKRTES